MSSFLVTVGCLGWEEVRFIEGSSFAKKTVTEWECGEELGVSAWSDSSDHREGEGPEALSQV